MVLKFSLNKSTSRTITLCSFSLVSVFTASCGKYSLGSTVQEGEVSSDARPTPSGSESNILKASTDETSQCSGTSADFCVYEGIENDQAVQITFTPDKDSVTNTNAIITLNEGEDATEWSITSCTSPVITSSEPCTALLKFNPKKATSGVKKLTLHYTYTNSKGKAVISDPISFKYQAIPLFNQITPVTGIDLDTLTQASVIGTDMYALKNKRVCVNKEDKQECVNEQDFVNISDIDKNPIVKKYDHIYDDILNFDATQLLTSQNIMLRDAHKNYANYNNKTGEVSPLDFQTKNNALMKVEVGKNATYGCKMKAEITSIPANGVVSTYSFQLPAHPLINDCFVDNSIEDNEVLYVVSHDEGQSEGYYLSALTTRAGEITGVQAVSPLIIKTSSSEFIADVTISNNSIFLVSNNGNIYAFTKDDSAQTITPITDFKYSASGIITFAPHYDAKNSLIYLVTPSGDNGSTLRQISSVTGVEQWSHPFTEKISDPILTSKSKRILVASKDGNAYTFSNTSSNPIKIFPLGEGINSSATALDNENNMLYIPASSSGTSSIYTFHTDW